MHSKIVQISKSQKAEPIYPHDLPDWFFEEGYADYADYVTAETDKEEIYKWFADSPGTNYNSSKHLLQFNLKQLIHIPNYADYDVMYFYVSDDSIEEESRLMNYYEFVELLEGMEKINDSNCDHNYYVINALDYHF